MDRIFHEFHFGNAIPSQSVTDATVQGTVIVRPWEKGRQLAFLLNGGAFGVAASGRLRVLARVAATGAFEALKVYGTATDLEFDQAPLDDAGAAENGVLIGTLDLRYVDTEKYDAIRPDFEAETAAVAQIVSVSYLIGDLYTKPSGTKDQLFYKHTPFTAPV